ncbi:zinc-binding dehydrogenase [Salsipaludibacter albus]|uniref:zinc-binding dehydrogenase n=1 Tax=Salsipaludibacter albus TaxID=2849650 RepID=UPI001EE3BB29|nr:zinc-binding dehydrogenase [Salsipaludibacter albus]MBY5164333.1 zinc-binding dehydrogenase [Salsipaludibacter albus]
MLAVSAHAFDPDDPLTGLRVDEVPDPDVPDGWELVSVRAAGLNHHDLWSLRGVGLSSDQLPMILGGDAAGVTTDGREVVCHGVVAGPDGLGDELDPHTRSSLFSEHFPGTHAELVAVPRRNLLDKPPELTFAEAACLPVAWLTAYRMLFVRGGFRPGDTVLVQGAGGGVSTAAVLLGRAAGLRMWVTSRDEGKRARAIELGADDAFEAGARLPERVDGVLETVGRATWDHSLKSTRNQGTVVVAGMTSGDVERGGLPHLFFRQLQVVGSTMGTRGELRSLLRFLVTTGVRPLIDATYPLADAASAYARMAEGDLFGKIVLLP